MGDWTLQQLMMHLVFLMLITYMTRKRNNMLPSEPIAAAPYEVDLNADGTVTILMEDLILRY